MKKAISFLLTVCLFIQQQAMSQTAGVNLEKYWYYRYRLMNDFMLIGNCQGCSLPAFRRNGVILQWGDTTIDLGFYIGILATEYRMLRDQGQPLDSIRRELFYALEAFNRLDFSAEQHWGGTASLNGFFIRDDVNKSEPDFVDNNFSHFNSNLTSTSTVSNVESNFGTGNQPTEESHDQVWYMMMGLSLVAKLVDAGDVYTDQTGTVRLFLDGEDNFAQEAKNITDRMIKHMQFNGWVITNPAIPGPINYVKNGPSPTAPRERDLATAANAQLLSFGAAEAACAIKDNFTPRHTSATPPVNCGLYHIPFGLHDLSLGFTVWQTFKLLPSCAQNAEQIIIPLDPLIVVAFAAIGVSVSKIVIPVCKACQEDVKYLLVAAIGNSIFSCDPSCLIPEKIIIPFPCGIAGGTIIYCNFEVQLRTYDNKTSFILFLRSLVGFEQLPLLHKILWPSELFFPPPGFYDNFLNTAPCMGPQHLSATDVTNHPLWVTPNTFRNPENRGVSVADTSKCELVENGEFAGLDYMLLYNMHRLVYGSSVPYPNMIDRSITGTQTGTETIKAFRSITSNAKITSTAKITYRAGEMIELTDGFETELGAEFETELGKFSCNATTGYQKTAGAWDGWDMLASSDTAGFQGDPGLQVVSESQQNNRYFDYELFGVRYSDTIPQELFADTALVMNYIRERIKKNYLDLLFQNQKSELFIYPNPNGGKFALFFKTISDIQYSVRITDMVGRTVYEKQGMLQQFTNVDISSQSKGVYYIRVIQGENVFNEKIIVK